MNPDPYHHVVYWSEEDQAYAGKCPDLSRYSGDIDVFHEKSPGYTPEVERNNQKPNP